MDSILRAFSRKATNAAVTSADPWIAKVYQTQTQPEIYFHYYKTPIVRFIPSATKWGALGLGAFCFQFEPAPLYQFMPGPVGAKYRPKAKFE
eukprot:TRINITY_DN15127_c0_g1_i1.p1 TRINITY_DN15127_c0_g1~~TRINITY_DN15127_c0_g1_i1.p1  ORF type:complete len:107 (+),score=15.91 TRINITY_DN15127_c0_g1_i1:47-322(+)